MCPQVVSYDKTERVYNPPMPLLFQCRRRLESRPVSETSLRGYLDHALAAIGVKDGTGSPLRYTFHDFRRLFITEAILHGMPPHIAQLVAGHRNINTTMGYKAVYPEEVINGHRAFIARRRALRPSEEYRVPTDEEWTDFLGHFEHRKVAIGDCGRSYATACIHEHACLRCPLLRPGPAARPRLIQIRDNLIARIAEAETHHWLGEAEGLKVSLAGAHAKLDQWTRSPPDAPTPSSSASPASPTPPATPSPARLHPRPSSSPNGTAYRTNSTIHNNLSSDKMSGTPPTWRTCWGWVDSRRHGSRRRPPVSSENWFGTARSWSGSGRIARPRCTRCWPSAGCRC